MIWKPHLLFCFRIHSRWHDPLAWCAPHKRPVLPKHSLLNLQIQGHGGTVTGSADTRSCDWDQRCSISTACLMHTEIKTTSEMKSRKTEESPKNKSRWGNPFSWEILKTFIHFFFQPGASVRTLSFLTGCKLRVSASSGYGLQWHIQSVKKGKKKLSYLKYSYLGLQTDMCSS